MKRTLWSAILLLLVCLTLIAGVERYDAVRQDEAGADEIARQLQPLHARLQARLDAMIGENRKLASEFAAHPDLAGPALEAVVGAALARQPRLLSVVVTRKLKVVSVFPSQGNEAMIGLDYGLHPEFMGAINRAIQARDTVVDAPVRLLQTGREGLIVRTPIFAPSGEFAGMVSMAADIEGLLLEAGLLEPSLEFTPVIRQHAAGQMERRVFGAGESPRRAGVSVAMPDGNWSLHAAPKLSLGHDPSRSRWIRGIGAVATFMLLLFVLRRGGMLGGAKPVMAERGIALRSLMLLAVLIAIPLLVGAAGWLSYHASMQVAESLEQRQAAELAGQIRDKVTVFFDVPRQVDAFNAELFRQGLLDPDRPEAVLSAFLAQFRQQPLLTFLSMGNAEGEYFAASRPPLGDDKTLRILRATRAEDRAMKLFRVDDANRPSNLVSVGNAHFDARTRPWYEVAVAADSLKWYPAYRYVINDGQGRYDAMGIGMSAPLYDPEHRFVGVVTADVALSQLGDFLKAQVAGLGGTAFIAEADGSLLASSDAEAIYRLDGANTLRIRADQSDNPGIRAAGATIRAVGAAAGNRFIQVGGRRYLLDWQSAQLPDGPTLTIALALPESRFSGPAETAFHDVGYLALVFLGLGLVIALFFTYRFTQPLLSLEHWARRLGAGEWRAALPISSPIREIAGLTHSLGAMAEQLQRHAEELEHRVAERTSALADANRKLAALSLTDGLTGIANRRRFDDAAAAEWSRVARAGRPLALLLLDVDLFKSYNDHHGHQAGDEALKRIAAVLGDNARRPGDLAARYGGEEFAVVAADTPPEAALKIAENIRVGVEALALPHASTPQGLVTVSIGVAVTGPDSPADLNTLIGMADAALYRAKAAGRNRIELAEPARVSH